MEALEMDRIRAEKFGEDNAEGILLANQADQTFAKDPTPRKQKRAKQTTN